MKINEIDLATVKSYLKIDFDEDDELLTTMLVSAQSFIQGYLNQKFEDFDEIPEEFTIAALSIISHWYARREIMSDKNTKDELPYVFSGLLDPYRVWGKSV